MNITENILSQPPAVPVLPAPLTMISKPVGYSVSPITIDASGSITAYVNVQVDNGAAGMVSIGTQNHYLPADEAVVVLSAQASPGQTVIQLLSAEIIKALKAKGLIQF
ncbi:hypothetical protein [Iodobacter fluviatilis]|uniref:Uncharacterized protein n=1 Tax=Iodobacter fluviatilis TaxID=537 RepID=A0A7G3GBP7_9NEIS|nr:hypothetical protein [Iodobacter fluviatilis]QBC44472.1 hypothetical protein C1H71_13640 [Iodobacter fluviatilis]